MVINNTNKVSNNQIETIHFTLRLNTQVHKKVSERAIKNKRSLNKEIEFILENELNK